MLTKFLVPSLSLALASWRREPLGHRWCDPDDPHQYLTAARYCELGLNGSSQSTVLLPNGIQLGILSLWFCLEHHGRNAGLTSAPLSGVGGGSSGCRCALAGLPDGLLKIQVIFGCWGTCVKTTIEGGACQLGRGHGGVAFLLFLWIRVTWPSLGTFTPGPGPRGRTRPESG